jgi:hypothetical protein
LLPGEVPKGCESGNPVWEDLPDDEPGLFVNCDTSKSERGKEEEEREGEVVVAQWGTRKCE